VLPRLNAANVGRKAQLWVAILRVVRKAIMFHVLLSFLDVDGIV